MSLRASETGNLSGIRTFDASDCYITLFRGRKTDLLWDCNPDLEILLKVVGAESQGVVSEDIVLPIIGGNARSS